MTWFEVGFWFSFGTILGAGLALAILSTVLLMVLAYIDWRMQR